MVRSAAPATSLPNHEFKSVPTRRSWYELIIERVYLLLREERCDQMGITTLDVVANDEEGCAAAVAACQRYTTRLPNVEVSDKYCTVHSDSVSASW